MRASPFLSQKKGPPLHEKRALGVYQANAGLELVNVGSLELAVLTGGDVKLDDLALVEGLEAVHLNLGVVHEQIVAVLARDETVALVRIEPLNSTLSHDVPFYLSPPIGDAGARWVARLYNTG